MPLRSVYQIDFDQAIAGYEKLIDLAEKHNRIVQQMPVMTGFGAISPRGGGASGNRNMMSDMERATDRLNRAWSKMRDDSRSVVNNVREIVSRFMTLSGLLGGLTGLAGLFGALGFNSMARGAAGGSMTALGAGVPYGGFSMARSGFGLWGNVPGMLTGIANMRQNPSQQLALQMLFGQGGVPGPGADPTQTMMRLMQGAGNLFNKFGPNAGAMWETIPGLSGLVTLEQARMAAGMGQGEIQEFGARARRFGAMGGQPNEQDMRNYRAFVQTLDLSRQTIENTFVRGLSPLAPKLEQMTGEITKFITALLKRPEIGQFIDTLANGIQKWATELGEFTNSLIKGDYNAQIKEVANQIKQFGSDLSELASELVSAASVVKQFIGSFNQKDTSQHYQQRLEHPAEGMGEGLKTLQDWFLNFFTKNLPQSPLAPGPSTPNIPPTGPLFGPQMMPNVHHSAYQIGAGGDANLPSVRVWPLPLPVTIQWPADEGGGGGQGGAVQNATYNIPSGNGPIAPYSGLPPQATGGGSLDERAQWLMGHLMKDMGATPAGAAGFASNIASESGIREGAIGPGGDFGIEQLVGSRKLNFMKWAHGQGLNPGSRDAQLQWMEMELQSPQYKKYLEIMRHATDPGQAQWQTFGFESNNAPSLEYHRRDHGRFVQQFMDLMKRMQQRDPGLHETPAAPAPMSGRPQSGPTQSLQVRIYNETGGNSVISTAQLAV